MDVKPLPSHICDVINVSDEEHIVLQCVYKPSLGHHTYSPVTWPNCFTEISCVSKST